MAASFEETLQPMELLIPYADGATLSELYAIAGHVDRKERDDGVLVKARVPPGGRAPLRELLGQRRRVVSGLATPRSESPAGCRARDTARAMSQENVEIVRNAFDAFTRGDMEGVLRLCDEDILITQPQELPGVSQQQRGHSGVLEAFSIWPEQWDDYRTEILRMVDSGDYVVVTTQTGGRGKRSRVEVEMEFTLVFSVRNERIVEMQIFMREDQALDAAGLSE